MANDKSLLAHLAWTFTNQTETLTTEALGYILSQSSAARQALQETVRTGGADVGPITQVKTEVTGDGGARPDLVGSDEHGSERVLVEVKFWAGLTDNQPNTYLERLPADANPAVLLFVAPEARLETLWTEVLRRAGEKFNLEVTEKQGIKTAVVDKSERWLMLTSWRALLGSMSSRASIDGDSSAERDILQLNALCEREDTDAFLPLRSEEFGPTFPRRMLNLQKLVDDATERGRKAGFVDTKGRNVAPRALGYGKKLRIGSKDTAWAEAWFGVNYHRWVYEEETPLWLELDNSFISTADIINKIDYDHASFTLRVGVEYEEVLDSVVHRLRDIAEDIQGSTP